MAKLEIHKKIRNSVRRVGTRRFFTALTLIIAGLLWKFVQLTGDQSSGLTLQKILSFWPLFWALWMGSGFLWWVLSGFKSVNGLIFSFAGGVFLAETAMPGVVINMDNWPYFIILIGLILFALPRKNYATTAYSYGDTRHYEQMKDGKTKSHRKHRSSTNSEATNSDSSAE